MRLNNQLAMAQKIIFLFFIMSIISCKQDETNNSPFLNCWIHSYEEDNADEIKHYRPCDYMEFAPSRYRNSFDLKENGSCTFLVLAANDAHYSENGTWNYNAETKILQIQNEDNMIVYEFEVLEIETDKLVLK